MKKSSVGEFDCSIAKTVSTIGDTWSLLILRNAFHGMRRFEDFQKHLCIATNILTDRLKRLTKAEILYRVKDQDDARRVQYRLTEKGFALYPVLVALKDWGDKWEGNYDQPRMVLRVRETGELIPPVAVRTSDGRALHPQEVTPTLGEGADELTKELVEFRVKD
ncbi:MAG: helix-turn-helix transcriptional regulator [Rhodospirillales bacterium]|nr:helix-turn-helix transcriptional regulator [Rhodospirillales bacterium]